MNVPVRLVVGVFAVSLVAAGATQAHATAKMLSDAKKAGLPATNCQYCHTEAMPKKDTFKPEALNDRGQQLLEDQKKRNLKAPDFTILKTAPDGGKK